MLKSQGFNLNFLNIYGLFHSFVKFLVEVHGFESTGYLVSQVRGT